ncbi:methyl-accepting chemotaxis protein [Lacipirellula parvula]|uniref:Methyl-accepting chemotaxis protein n=1 Tax=Lacipirellula parvula TaxID=2650471 RepID=A0A5K7XM94_9BACT|nr:methyl-accepting chemotaxis protein [Lacipirellula parvula]BBO34129.1 methyl-accepting chemotaxis protein [Lacipirellula parvula]
MSATILTDKSTAAVAGDQAEACRERSFSELLGDLSNSLDAAIGEIRDINTNTKLLSLNARIEAARAGLAGAAFGVVAQEMQDLSAKTAQAADSLANQTKRVIEELVDVLGTKVRGTRLSDIALTNIDLIDRCLYERTCDVRWWATDQSVVDALTAPTPEALRHASQRMGVILSAYTVYYDLVLCDLHGQVVANGRPHEYKSTGMSQASETWFREAAASSSGDEFGFQTANRSPLVDGKLSLIYSCGVRQEGKADGKLLGVLGIVFNWEALAQTIMTSAPVAEEERAATRCVITDGDGTILADSWGKQLQERLSLPDLSSILAERKNFTTGDYRGQACCIAHAQAPGFETYSTGWHSLVIQPVD